MLKFYYHPLSPIARRVWIALLEKEISFEPVLIDLRRGKHLEPDFLRLNPFHHVPAMVDGKVHLIESLAILDYLDRQFLEVPLSPIEPAAYAEMRMVQMVVTNELLPKLVSVAVASEAQPISEEKASHIETCLQFLEQQIGEKDYFGGAAINLADVVAGSTVPLFNRLGVSLQEYPMLKAWNDRVSDRSAWQMTKPSDHDFEQWQRWLQIQVKQHQRKLAKTSG